MAFERKNPIPPGTYYVEVPDKSVTNPVRMKAFTAWAKKHGVEVLEKKRTLRGDFLSAWNRASVTWVLFRLKKSTPRWPLTLPIGAPTIAKPGVKKQADTTKRPKKKSVREHWGFPEMTMPSGGALAVLALAGAWAFSRK